MPISQGSNPFGSSITTDNIADGAVTEPKLAEDTRPSRFDIHPHDYTTITQGTWAAGSNAARIYTDWRNAGSSADGDGMTYTCWIAEGTYTLIVTHDTQPDAGIIEIAGAASYGTIDAYTGGQVLNVRTEITGINVTSSGEQTITIDINGKNASSADFFMYLQSVTFIRTGAST